MRAQRLGMRGVLLQTNQCNTPCVAVLHVHCFAFQEHPRLSPAWHQSGLTALLLHVPSPCQPSLPARLPRTCMSPSSWSVLAPSPPRMPAEGGSSALASPCAQVRSVCKGSFVPGQGTAHDRAHFICRFTPTPSAALSRLQALCRPLRCCDGADGNPRPTSPCVPPRGLPSCRQAPGLCSLGGRHAHQPTVATSLSPGAAGAHCPAGHRGPGAGSKLRRRGRGRRRRRRRPGAPAGRPGTGTCGERSERTRVAARCGSGPEGDDMGQLNAAGAAALGGGRGSGGRASDTNAPGLSDAGRWRCGSAAECVLVPLPQPLTPRHGAPAHPH